jgi:anaerobic selenocysteine-containing dehydrogenase
MLHTLFAERRAPSARLELACDGLDELRRAAARFSPERVAARAGIAPDTIRELARQFASAESAACYGRVGLCTQEYGGVAAWLANALNAVTGNLDRAGGVMFTTPAADLVDVATRIGEVGHYDVWRSRVRGLPEFGGELPVATLAEEIETPGDGQIRALITVAGNPVLSTPNGGRLERALARLELMVSVDIYRNETTRHAHLILPTHVGFERDHYDLVFYAFAVRNAARYAPALLPPPPGTRPDWQVLLDLALAVHRRGGGRRSLGAHLSAAALRRVGPRRALDALLRFGPHRRHPGGMSLAALARAGHGVDLGPLEPRLERLIATANRRVQLAPPRLAADLARLEAELDAAPRAGGLVLIGRRGLRSNNSWMHNSERLVKGKPACTLLMHPDDARRRALTAGAEVEVRSRVGRVRVPLEVTDEIAPGVVSLPHGFGHGRPGVELAVARAHAGASVNDLTDERAVDPLSGTAGLSGVPVEVGRVRTTDVAGG